MNKDTIEYIITALERGVPMAISVYHEVATDIARSKEVDAENKVNLLARLSAAMLPERIFVPK